MARFEIKSHLGKFSGSSSGICNTYHQVWTTVSVQLPKPSRRKCKTEGGGKGSGRNWNRGITETNGNWAMPTSCKENVLYFRQ